MRISLNAMLFACLICLFSHPAKADTYFLKIEQMDVDTPETFLQTCSPKTSPCTFVIPVQLKKGGKKDIAVVMRFKEPPYVYLQFYWGQAALGTNNAGEEYYTLLAGAPDKKLDPRIITLYVPLSPGQKPAKGAPVLKYSEKEIASLTATVIVTKSQE